VPRSERPLVQDDAASIVSRRSAPRVYVTDSTGDVILRGTEDGSLTAQARATVLKLIASDGGDDALIGLTGSGGEIVRLVRLHGAGRPHYAIFLERVAKRSPLSVAAARFRLTERESEVLGHVLRGSSTSAIADELMIAESTVATHVRNIGTKMNASKRKEIVAAVLWRR
jgi:DNA-binding NarL/FixJ family response regulator